MIAEIVGSYWLALTFQASHVVSEVGSKVISKPMSNNTDRLDRGKFARMDISCFNFYCPAIICPLVFEAGESGPDKSASKKFNLAAEN